MTDVEVGPLEELPPGAIEDRSRGRARVCVYNLGGELCAIEDRCSHDDGPLCEGDFDAEGASSLPAHGSRFDIRTGRPLTLPAFVPVATFPVRVEDGIVKVET